MIEVRDLTQEYGDERVLDRVSFVARRGEVTGLLGPSGSGKSVLMRLILGTESPTAGTVLVNGLSRTGVSRRTVAAMVADRELDDSRSAADHLWHLAVGDGVGRRRVAEVLEEAGLSAVAAKPVGCLSTGARQRLRIAGVLLAGAEVLLFDSPMTGLDAGGIRWARELLNSLAREGRTVLVSGSDVNEMMFTARQVFVLRRGELIVESSAHELVEHFRGDVFVRSPRRGALMRLLSRMGGTVLPEPGGGLAVTGVEAWQIASVAAAHFIPVQEITPRVVSLEEFCGQTETDSQNGRLEEQPEILQRTHK